MGSVAEAGRQLAFELASTGRQPKTFGRHCPASPRIREVSPEQGGAGQDAADDVVVDMTADAGRTEQQVGAELVGQVGQRAGERRSDIVVGERRAEQGGCILIAAVLNRRSRTAHITVRADVVESVQPPDATAAVLPRLEPIKASLPPGYRIDTGGSVEESAKANIALAAIFPIMIVLMLTVILFQVRLFGIMLMTFLTAPLGLIGAAPTLLLFNQPFGFNAILGLIGLAGILMRNTLILVEQIRTERAAGLSDYDAIVEASVRRPAGDADRPRGRARLYAVDPVELLGPACVYADWRHARRDRFDIAFPARPLRALVTRSGSRRQARAASRPAELDWPAATGPGCTPTKCLTARYSVTPPHALRSTGGSVLAR